MTSNEIIKIDFAAEQLHLIKTQVAPNANENELKLFLYQCKRTGLDPLTRQIYCIHRGGRMTIQTSIDGFRVIAERSGTYAGQDEPVFEYDQHGRLKCAKVTVYRFSPNGQRYPAATGVAFFDEYVQMINGKPSGLWTKPHIMLQKVAEALALRKAYPQDLSGLYTGDEMDQSEVKLEPVGLPRIDAKTFLLAMEKAADDPTVYERVIKKYTLTEAQKITLRDKSKTNDAGNNDIKPGIAV